jgi:hypothetical protein
MYKLIVYGFLFLIFAVLLLVNLYLIMGLLFPGVSLQIEQRFMGAFRRKSGSIIWGDSDRYVRRRNLKLSIWFNLVSIIIQLTMYLIMFP